MTTPENSGLGAALLQLSQCIGRLAVLERQVAENLAECQISAAGTGDGITDLRAVVEEQGRLLEATGQQVQTLLPPAPPPSGVYQIGAAVHWWSAKAEDRQQAADSLRAWVEQVYRPHYGHLAAMLADCWPDHDLCLVLLDVLSELHGYLYFTRRNAAILNAQAEFNARILPATAELLRIECSVCEHNRRPGTKGGGWRDAR